MIMATAGSAVIWTVGHSNHSAERLLELLTAQGIEAVADVRSSPYSRYSPQFNKDQLSRALESHSIRYVFLGSELGGRPSDSALYDSEGRVRYDVLAETESFRAGIDRLIGGSKEYRVAVLCGEEDPISCHRRRLIGRSLRDRGVEIRHVRGDGTVLTEAEIEAREMIEFPDRFQLTLAGPPPWRSEHPVKSAVEGSGDR